MILDGYTVPVKNIGLVRPMTIATRVMALKVLEAESNWEEDDYKELLTSIILSRVVSISNDSRMAVELLLEDEENFNQAFQTILGKDYDENADIIQLQETVAVHLRYPRLLNFSCDTCRKWVSNPLKGTYRKYARGPEDSLLCDTREGCPKGHHSNPLKWLRRHWQAYKYDLQCRAYAQWPNDDIVLLHKFVIDQEIEKFQAELP